MRNRTRRRCRPVGRRVGGDRDHGGRFRYRRRCLSKRTSALRAERRSLRSFRTACCTTLHFRRLPQMGTAILQRDAAGALRKAERGKRETRRAGFGYPLADKRCQPVSFVAWSLLIHPFDIVILSEAPACLFRRSIGGGRTRSRGICCLSGAVGMTGREMNRCEHPATADDPQILRLRSSAARTPSLRMTISKKENVEMHCVAFRMTNSEGATHS